MAPVKTFLAALLLMAGSASAAKGGDVGNGGNGGNGVSPPIIDGACTNETNVACPVGTSQCKYEYGNSTSVTCTIGNSTIILTPTRVSPTSGNETLSFTFNITTLSGPDVDIIVKQVLVKASTTTCAYAPGAFPYSGIFNTSSNGKGVSNFAICGVQGDCRTDTVCRPANGTCDVAETCYAGACPTNLYASPNTTCSGPASPCNDNFCNGFGSCAPVFAVNNTDNCTAPAFCSKAVCAAYVNGTGYCSSAPDTAKINTTCGRIPDNVTEPCALPGVCTISGECTNITRDTNETPCGNSTTRVCTRPATCADTGYTGDYGCAANPGVDVDDRCNNDEAGIYGNDTVCAEPVCVNSTCISSAKNGTEGDVCEQPATVCDLPLTCVSDKCGGPGGDQCEPPSRRASLRHLL